MFQANSGCWMFWGFFNGKAQATPAEMDLIQLFVLLSFQADFIFSLFNLLLAQAAVINAWHLCVFNYGLASDGRSSAFIEPGEERCVTFLGGKVKN